MRILNLIKNKQENYKIKSRWKIKLTYIYINEIKQKKEKEILKEELFFGQGMGIVLIIIAGLKYLATTHIIVEYISIIAMSLGLIILLLGIIFPYPLYYPSKWMKNFINKFFFSNIRDNIINNIYISIITSCINKKKRMGK